MVVFSRLPTRKENWQKIFHWEMLTDASVPQVDIYDLPRSSAFQWK